MYLNSQVFFGKNSTKASGVAKSLDQAIAKNQDYFSVVIILDF